MMARKGLARGCCRLRLEALEPRVLLSVADFISGIDIHQRWYYGASSPGPESYEFQIGVQTTTDVSALEVQTPAGTIYQWGRGDSLVQDGVMLDQGDDAGAAWWMAVGSFDNATALDRFGDGWYTFIATTAGGPEQTDVWFGVPGTADPIPQPTQKPTFTNPGATATPSPVDIAWEACADPAADLIHLGVYDPGTDARLLDLDLATTETGSGPHALADGDYALELAFMVSHYSQTAEDVPFSALKYSRHERTLEIGAGGGPGGDGDIVLIDSHTYADGVTVSIFDSDDSNGTSAPNIAWSRAEYVRDVTDVLVDPGRIGDAVVNGIRLYGDGTRTVDVGFVVDGNTGLKKFDDRRTGTPPLGFLVSEGYVGKVKLKEGLAGANINGLVTPTGVLPSDIDGDGDTGDATGLALVNGAKTIDIAGPVDGDVASAADVGLARFRDALNGEVVIDGYLKKLDVFGDWAGGVRAERVGSARTKGTLSAAIQLTEQDAKGVSLKKLQAGRIAGAALGAVGGVKSVKGFEWLDGWLVAGWLGSLSITGAKSIPGVDGDFTPSVVLSGEGAAKHALGKAKIAGEVGEGTWDIEGSAGSLVLGSTVATWAANFTGAVGKATVKGNASGGLAAASFGSVKVGGDLLQAQVLAGADLGSDAAIGGTGDDADTFGPGSCRSFKVAGQMAESIVAAGLDPLDGVLNNGTELFPDAASSGFKSVSVGGAMDGQSRLFGGLFPKSAKVDGGKVAPRFDPCFRVAGTGMLTDAYKLVAAPPDSADITYTDTEGDVWTVEGAEGRVALFVDPSTPWADVAVLAGLNGGTVIAQIPEAGMYWAGVAVGGEAAFIDAVRLHPLIVSVSPEILLGRGTVLGEVVDISEQPLAGSASPLIVPGDVAVLDDYVLEDCCGINVSHGDAATYLTQTSQAGEPAVRSSRYQVMYPHPGSGDPCVYPADLVWHIQRIAEGARETGAVKVVSMSIQGGGSEQTTKNHLRYVYAAVNTLPDSLRDQVAVVVIAGNQGHDLTDEMADLQAKMPNAVENVVVVGSLDTGGAVETAHNYSTNPAQMVYAPGVSVPVTVDGKTGAGNGTSFAGPQVARLLAQLKAQAPDLSARELIAAVRRAAALQTGQPGFPNGYRAIPTLEAAAAAALNQPGITVKPTKGLVTTEEGGQATFTIVLDAPPIADVTLSVAISDATEGSVATGSVTFTQANWAEPKTVTVTGEDDDVADGDQAFTVVLGAAVSDDPVYSGIDPADVSVTNLDDDAPAIVVEPTSGLETTEGGSTAQFGIVLTTRPAADVTIDLSSSDTTEGEVFPDSITFTPDDWNIPWIIDVDGVDDDEDDGDKSYEIITARAVSDDPAYDGMNPDDVSLVNIDDDDAPTIYPAVTITGISYQLVAEHQYFWTYELVATGFATGSVGSEVALTCDWGGAFSDLDTPSWTQPGLTATAWRRAPGDPGTTAWTYTTGVDVWKPGPLNVTVRADVVDWVFSVRVFDTGSTLIG